MAYDEAPSRRAGRSQSRASEDDDREELLNRTKLLEEGAKAAQDQLRKDNLKNQALLEKQSAELQFQQELTKYLTQELHNFKAQSDQQMVDNQRTLHQLLDEHEAALTQQHDQYQHFLRQAEGHAKRYIEYFKQQHQVDKEALEREYQQKLQDIKDDLKKQKSANEPPNVNTLRSSEEAALSSLSDIYSNDTEISRIQGLDITEAMAVIRSIHDKQLHVAEVLEITLPALPETAPLAAQAIMVIDAQRTLYRAAQTCFKSNSRATSTTLAQLRVQQLNPHQYQLLSIAQVRRTASEANLDTEEPQRKRISADPVPSTPVPSAPPQPAIEGPTPRPALIGPPPALAITGPEESPTGDAPMNADEILIHY